MDKLGEPLKMGQPSSRMGHYDVFISHCGLDMKRDFAVWLKEEFERAGIRCFLDEVSLQIGDMAADRMLQAMETASYGIILLSPGFFLREWCMKELHTFQSRGRVVPIYLSAINTLKDAREKAVEQRVWERFQHFVRTEEEYVQAADASVTYSGLRLEAFDGFWDSLIRMAWIEMFGAFGQAGRRPSALGGRLLCRPGRAHG
jgi:hypothetical protein